MNQNYNILYSKHSIYALYVCTFVFLLRQESFDMTLVNNPSFYDGVLHYQVVPELEEAMPIMRDRRQRCRGTQ
jgi:hypothetical protein